MSKGAAADVGQMASTNRIVRFKNLCGLECKIVQGRGSNLGASETILANEEDGTVTFRSQALGSSFTVIVSGGSPAGTSFEVTSRDVTILSSGPIARFGEPPTNPSLASIVCDDGRVIATPLSFLNLRGQVIGVPTPSVTPGMSCNGVRPPTSGDVVDDDTEESFWMRNRVWIIILIAMSVALLIGAIILAIYLGMRKSKKAKRVTTIDDDGVMTTTTLVDDDE